jgi:biotin operon repressor
LTKKKRRALIDACGWVQVSNLILTDPKLSRDAKLLYQTLSMFSFGKRAVWPGQESLGQILGVKRNAISKWTKELTERGLVVLTHRGNKKTNYYHLAPLDQVYGDEDVDAYCDLSGRDPSRVRDYANYLLNLSGASVGMHHGASVGMHRDASVGMHEEEQLEEEQVEEEQVSTPTPAAPTRARTRKRRVRNPLAREIQPASSETSAKIAKKAAALAEKTEREAGGFAARRGRSGGGDGGFGRGFDRGADPYTESVREAESDRKQSRPRGKRQADLDPPHETTEFGPWSTFCASLCRRPKRQGRGVKDPEEWNANDFELYLGGMIQGWQGAEPPSVTSKTKAQAKRLLKSIGGDLAKDLLDFCLQNWVGIRNRLRLDTAAYPSAAIIEGYLESIKTLKKDGVAKVDVGINRVKETYDDQPDEGW